MAVAEVSRPPETNRADPENRRLTAQEGKTLRAELWDPTVDRGADVKTWGRAVELWRTYAVEADATSLVFEHGPTGKRAYANRAHRWSEDYREKRYAKLKDMERGIERFYGRAWTGLISLTASSRTCPNPVDFIDELRSSWEAVRRELYRRLRGRKWDYWWVIEPHESGYPHLHIAVIVEGRIAESDLRPLVDAHLRNCHHAGADAHGEDAVRIHPPGDIENVAAYLNSYMGGYGTKPEDMARKDQLLATVLWATGRRQFGASERLRGFMESPFGAPDPEWSLIAVLDAEGRERPVDRSEPGRVETFTTTIRWPPPP